MGAVCLKLAALGRECLVDYLLRLDFVIHRDLKQDLFTLLGRHRVTLRADVL
jgi:hypothetical protein